MQISITYKEIENQIFRRYKTTVGFSAVDEKIVCVSPKIKSFLPSVSLMMQIDSISGSDVFLSCDSGFLTKGLATGMVLFFREKYSEQISFTERNHFVIHLVNIKKLENFFDLFELEDIVFLEDKMLFHFEFKTPIIF